VQRTPFMAPTSTIGAQSHHFNSHSRYFQMSAQLVCGCSDDLVIAIAMDWPELPCRTREIAHWNSTPDENCLHSCKVAKWSDLKRLRDTRNATAGYANSMPLKTCIAAYVGESASGNRIIFSTRLGISDDAATPRSSLHQDPPDPRIHPTDALRNQHQALTGSTDPLATDADAEVAAALARPRAARSVRFAEQLEEPPPVALHRPRSSAAGGRGACAARLLRAVSCTLARALRRAPG
jgi:hypothetical protein